MFRPSCCSRLTSGSAFIAGDVGRVRVGHDLAFAGLQLLVAHRGIGRDREHQIVDRCLAAPVVGVGLVADHRVLLVVDELERPGADRLEVELLGRAGLHHLVGVLRRHDRGEVHRDVGDERRLRRRSVNLTVMVVDLLDRLEQVAHVHAGEVFVRAARDLVVGMVRVELPLEREHHVVGVEVARRREALGGLPLHARAQLEGVDRGRRRRRAALGQAGHGLGAAALELDQPVVDRLGRGIEGGAGGVQLRVEALRAALRADRPASSPRPRRSAPAPTPRPARRP